MGLAANAGPIAVSNTILLFARENPPARTVELRRDVIREPWPLYLCHDRPTLSLIALG
jgi:hypothetical protein